MKISEPWQLALILIAIGVAIIGGEFVIPWMLDHYRLRS